MHEEVLRRVQFFPLYVPPILLHYCRKLCYDSLTEHSVETENEFSSVQKTGDITMITMFVCATLANDIIMASLLLEYGHKEQGKEEKLK